MAVPVLDLSCSIACPHLGQATVVPGNTHVTLGGNPVLLVGDTFTITGCTFNVSGSPSPCVTIQWQQPATRTTAGQPVLLRSSIGLCLNAASVPQGVAIISGGQTKASAQ